MAENIEGNRPWESHPNPEESYSIAADEKFAKQGNLPKRTKLESDQGTIETFTPGNN